MPYICRTCDYFDAAAEQAGTCPNCGGRMSFTMLGPTAAPTAAAAVGRPAKPAWHNPYINGYEVLEAAATLRYAQLCAGISTYYFVYRWLPRALTLMAGGGWTKKVPAENVAALAVAILIANCIAALAGGFVAGFWSRNWLIQGLGVLLGVITITIATVFFAPPKNETMFIVTVTASSLLTLAGAYVGHLIVRPTRIPTS